MRAQVFLGALLLALGAVLWTRAPIGPGVPAALSDPPRAHVDPRDPRGAPGASPEAVPHLERDPFRYADQAGGRARTLGLARGRTPVPSGELSAAPGRPRLVGFIRNGDGLQAALSVDGELAVVGPGGRAGAYTVLAIDEDSGVRLQGPEGEIVLPPS